MPSAAEKSEMPSAACSCTSGNSAISMSTVHAAQYVCVDCGFRSSWVNIILVLVGVMGKR